MNNNFICANMYSVGMGIISVAGDMTFWLHIILFLIYFSICLWYFCRGVMEEGTRSE